MKRYLRLLLFDTPYDFSPIRDFVVFLIDEKFREIIQSIDRR